MTKWGEYITCKFVNEYKKYECLWNCNSKDYKSRIARIAAYKALAESIDIPNLSVADVKTKIKNLRSTFYQEEKKIKFSQNSGSDNVYKPHLKWYNEMKELVDKCGFTRYPQNYTEEVTQLPIENVEDDSPIEEYTFEDLNNTQLPPVSESSLKKSSDRKRRKTGNINKFIEVIQQLHGASSAVNNVNSSDDEFHFFGMNVASQLRKLPLDRALTIQVKIQNMLAEERIAVIDSHFNL